MKRTEHQERMIAALTKQGFVHDRDSKYTTNISRKTGILSVMFSKKRSAIIYPDGETVTRDRLRGGTRTIKYDNVKLAKAIDSHGFET